MYANRFVRRGLACLLVSLGLAAIPGCGPVSCAGGGCIVSVSIEITLEDWSIEGSYLIEVVEPGGVAVSCTVEVDAESSTASCTDNHGLRNDTQYTKVLWLNGRPDVLRVRVLRDGVVLVQHEGKVPYSHNGAEGCGQSCEAGKFVVAE